MLSAFQRDIVHWLDTRPDRQSHHSVKEIAIGIGIPAAKVKRALSKRVVFEYIASSKLINGEWHYNRLKDEGIYQGCVRRGIQPRVKVKLTVKEITIEVERKVE